ncbi:hypothetical protein LZ009_18295 [Ramlibacter sp. XY19]|uniref:hypothetical protein n=1 Tax=Ramlibacter paludis TaxID=2908000 RepID=UPI0023DCDFAA|nr:hypothetical protein [Ramlibacter paludis]MCG2594734.1 hypothetical protein [Ramlibacter paludis]
MLQWFATAKSVAFGKDLAAFVLRELAASTVKNETKFSAKAEKVLIRADQRVRDFAATERMNVYKRSKLANAFLWALKDAGCPPDYAQQLTEWLSYRL